MARVIVFQHGERQEPGRLGRTLRDHGFKLDIRRLDLLGGEGVPKDLDDVAALVILGGKQNVTEHLSWMDPEMEFIRRAHEADVPVIGICLGCQLIATALGGEVAPMARPEFGFTPVSLTIPAQTSTIFAGVPWTAPMFSSHGQEVTKLPAGAELLASSSACRVQAFRAGVRTYAFQYHFEADRAMVDHMIDTGQEMLAACELSGDAVRQQGEKGYDRFAVVADRLCVNLATYLFPIMSRLSA